MGCKSFTTDAAGCAEGFKLKGKVGCGCVGFSYDGVIIFTSQLFWPSSVLEGFRDSSGCLIGCKTTTLEFLGILIPFLFAPESLVNQLWKWITQAVFSDGWTNTHPVMKQLQFWYCSSTNQQLSRLCGACGAPPTHFFLGCRTCRQTVKRTVDNAARLAVVEFFLQKRPASLPPVMDAVPSRRLVFGWEFVKTCCVNLWELEIKKN